ncbi:MAG TPA: acyltransferase [Puia sp.]|jgi:peptidoglycan/LPS O-acetylase OafA/YrhL
MKTQNSRIPAIDGLRTLAVLGVLWTHVWMFFKNIPMKVGGLDLNRGMAFGRHGVDLFFVISGFCMYLMYASRIDHFSASNFFGFLKKRWLRIAPAFYMIVVFDSFLLLYHTGIFPLKQMSYHLLFINIFLDQYDFAPHYWSLATEFHFYLLFPFLFLRLRSQRELSLRVFALMAVCLIFRLILFYNHTNDILEKETITSTAIWYRFIEFGFGIIAAQLYVLKRVLPRWAIGSSGFILGLLISYAGKIIITTEFVRHFGTKAFIFRAFAEPIMTFGFGWMLISLITSGGIFTRVLSSRPFLFLGKISYSFYLWHWFVAHLVSNWLIAWGGMNLKTFYLSLLISLVVAIPIAFLSFRLFEAPYFKRNPKLKKMAYVEVV